MEEHCVASLRACLYDVDWEALSGSGLLDPRVFTGSDCELYFRNIFFTLKISINGKENMEEHCVASLRACLYDVDWEALSERSEFCSTHGYLILTRLYSEYFLPTSNLN